jgi:hypothetical protein
MDSVAHGARAAIHGYVTVRGAREHNLKNVTLEIPRDALGRLYRRVGFWKVIARLRHALR